MSPFPMTYTGTVSHPGLGDGIELSVLRTSAHAGKMTVKGETADCEIKEQDGMIGFGANGMEFVGKQESGVIEGAMLRNNAQEGTFRLTLQENKNESEGRPKHSAGSPVNAARSLKGKGEPGDEYRALSVWFIVNELMKDLGATDQSKVYDVEPEVRAKGADKDCPRDGKKGTAYVDVADDPHAGYATHMLSYTWGYNLKEIKDTLEAFCKDNNLNLKEVRVWMCFACVNQHRVKEAQANKETIPFEQFKKIFGERVQNIGHILPMMSPWNTPFYITRVWCCFEIFTAINLGDACKVTVLLPPKESTDFSEAFDKGAEREIFKALRSIDVETAEASVEEDKNNILKLIEEGPGYQTVNTEVVKHLQSWFMKQATRNEAERLGKLGRVYTTFGNFDAGLNLLRQGRLILESINDQYSPTGFNLMICLVEAEWNHGLHDLKDKTAPEQAWKSFMDAESVLKQRDCDKTQVAAELATKQCWVGRECGADMELLLSKAEHGRKLFANLGKIKSCEGMFHLFIYAFLLSDKAATVHGNILLGKGGTEDESSAAVKEAEAMFEEAISIGKELKLTDEEYYVKGIHTCGIMYQKLDKHDEAVDYFAEAKHAYEATGMTGTMWYLHCCIGASGSYECGNAKKDLNKAAACLKDCIKACGKDACGEDANLEMREQAAGRLKHIEAKLA